MRYPGLIGGYSGAADGRAGALALEGGAASMALPRTSPRMEQ